MDNGVHVQVHILFYLYKKKSFATNLRLFRNERLKSSEKKIRTNTYQYVYLVPKLTSARVTSFFFYISQSVLMRGNYEQKIRRFWKNVCIIVMHISQTGPRKYILNSMMLLSYTQSVQKKNYTRVIEQAQKNLVAEWAPKIRVSGTPYKQQCGEMG